MQALMGRTDGPEERLEAFIGNNLHENPTASQLTGWDACDHAPPEWPKWEQFTNIDEWDDWYDKMVLFFEASGIRRPATLRKMKNTDMKRLLKTFATSSKVIAPGATQKIDRVRALLPIVNCWSEGESKVLLNPGVKPADSKEWTGVNAAFDKTIRKPGPRAKRWESLEWEDQYKRAWIEVSRVEVCGVGGPH